LTNSRIFAGFAIYSHIKLAEETKLLNETSILFDEFAIIKLAVAGSNTEHLSDKIGNTSGRMVETFFVFGCVLATLLLFFFFVQFSVLH
jgi:hypothetical protein